MTAARNALSIFCAFVWTAIAAMLTTDRRVLVPLFVTVALLSWLAIALVQSGSVEEAS